LTVPWEIQEAAKIEGASNNGKRYIWNGNTVPE
jgi:ABC-type glycerol-3-phosphate transport system permease component